MANIKSRVLLDVPCKSVNGTTHVNTVEAISHEYKYLSQFVCSFTILPGFTSFMIYPPSIG